MEKYLKNITPLPDQGLCNKNYLSIVDDKKYVIREFKLKGIDREFEFQTQMSAYKIGIASKPIYLSDTFMISHFLEGVHKQKLLRSDLRDLAKLLNTLHDIEIKKHYKDRYLVLTHHDLNPKNILFSKRVKLIDWEFARVDDRYFDLASICVEFDLGRGSENYFLNHYFKKEKLIDLKKLKQFKKSYIKLCKEWANQHTYF